MTEAKRMEHEPILLSITINSLYKDDDPWTPERAIP